MRLIDADKLMESKFKNPISYAAFRNLVKRQTTVEPARREWIPCSERLPEDCADVFITYVHDFALTCPQEIRKMFVGTNKSGTLWEVPFADYIAFYDQEEKKWFMPTEDPTPFPDEIKVIAWMPLPEPYIEEKRENHEAN